MALEAQELMRRLLLHLLPDGLQRIRLVPTVSYAGGRTRQVREELETVVPARQPGEPSWGPCPERLPAITMAAATNDNVATARPNPIVTLALTANASTWLASIRIDTQKVVVTPAAVSNPSHRQCMVVLSRGRVRTLASRAT
jgi:hypothetical protein